MSRRHWATRRRSQLAFLGHVDGVYIGLKLVYMFSEAFCDHLSFDVVQWWVLKLPTFCDLVPLHFFMAMYRNCATLVPLQDISQAVTAGRDSVTEREGAILVFDHPSHEL